MSTRAKFLCLTILFLAATLLRIYYLFILYPLDKYLFSDMLMYLDNAKALLSGNTTTQYFSKPPFYEWLVAFSLKLSDWKIFTAPLSFIRILQFVLSLAIPVLLACSARKWLGKKVAVVVLIVGLFYFPFIEYAGLLMAEIPFAFFLALLILLLLKTPYPWRPKNALLVGSVWAISFFFKGQVILFPLIAFVYSALRTRYTKTIKSWSFFFVGAFVVYAFQAATQKWVFHIPNKVPAVAALNFAYARCDSCRMFIDSKGVWTCSPKYHQIGGCNKECHFPAPFEDSSFFWKQGARCLAENPFNILSSFSEISSLFVGNEAFPFMEISELRILNRNWEFLFQLFVLPGILFGFLWRFNLRGSQRVGIVHCLILTIFVTSYLFQGDVRYRIPFDTVFLPLSVAVYLKFISKFKLRSYYPPA